MAHDVFISYDHRDKPVADAICATLESNGIRCWIAPRDIVPGNNWPGAIVAAVPQSRMMVLVFSSNANQSDYVLREAELAAHARIPILPFRLEDVAPEHGLRLFLGIPHWLDAMTPPLERHLLELVAWVQRMLAGPRPESQSDEVQGFEPPWQAPHRNRAPRPPGGVYGWAATLAVLLSAAGLLGFRFWPRGPVGMLPCPPSPPAAVLYEDDFSNPSKGKWPTAPEDAADYTNFVKDGRLNLIVKRPAGEWQWAWPQAPPVSNFAYEAAVTKVSGGNDDSYGIGFRHWGDKNFYYFAVESDGFYEFGTWGDSRDPSQAINVTILRDSIPAGLASADGVPNIFKADAVGDRFRLYLNGHLLTERHDRFGAGGTFGVYARLGSPDAPIQIAVSHMKVTQC